MDLLSNSRCWLILAVTGFTVSFPGQEKLVDNCIVGGRFAEAVKKIGNSSPASGSKREIMKRSGKRKLSVIFAVVLTVFVVILEFSLRIVGSFSPAAHRYIHGLLQNHPLIDGFLCAFFMVSGGYIAYVKYMEQKTKVRLATCIITLPIFLGLLLYSFFIIHRSNPAQVL
ncbi:MAG: hypothetical protein WCA04_01895 [Geobacteraceae bacterium]